MPKRRVVKERSIFVVNRVVVEEEVVVEGDAIEWVVLGFVFLCVLLL